MIFDKNLKKVQLLMNTACLSVSLIRPFGALKRVFLQKHHTGQYNNGGYGFVEYLNAEEAKVRRLCLQYREL